MHHVEHADQNIQKHAGTDRIADTGHVTARYEFVQHEKQKENASTWQAHRGT